MFKFPKLTKLERSWVLYDVANSAFVLTVITVLFPILYKIVYEDSGLDNFATKGTVYLKFLTAGIAFTVAILSPIVGAWVNFKDNKSKLFKLFLFLGIIGGFGLAIPGLSWITLLVIFALSSIGFNLTNVVYDAFLVDVTTPEKMDEISAFGFGMGYIGSMIPFFIGIIPFGLVSLGKISEDYSVYAISFAFFISVLWWFLYSLPILKNVKQKYVAEGEGTLGDSLARLGRTFKEIKNYKNVFIFMIAYLLYIDVVNTVIRLATNIGGDLNVGDITLLGVVVLVQLIAFPCAILFGRMTKKFGPKKMIFYGITMYFITILVVFNITVGREWLMWVVALLIGTAQGGIQAVSRSFFARIIPTERANDFFGFFSVFGRFGGIISPFLIGMFQVSMDGMWGNNGINNAVLLLTIPLGLGAIIFAFVKDEKSELIGE